MPPPNNDLVSVIIPVYNGAKFIIDALVSVKGQTYDTWECIVVDDGSTDNTAALVKEWIGVDPRFKYIYQPNKGLSGARNTGLEHAKGDMIQFLDADDVLLPAKMAKQLEHFWNAPDRGRKLISYTDYTGGSSTDIFKPSDYYMSSQFDLEDYLSAFVSGWESTLSIPPHCFLFSAYFFREKNIRFDISLPNHEDFDCWLSILALTPRIMYLDEKLCIYRITEGSMSKQMRLMGEGFLQVLNKHIQMPGQQAKLKKLLIRKRRMVLRFYLRFDLMTWKEKILSIACISRYYSRRILEKARLPT